MLQLEETKVEEEVAEEKPEDKKKSEEKQKPKLPLTWDNVQEAGKDRQCTQGIDCCNVGRFWTSYGPT